MTTAVESSAIAIVAFLIGLFVAGVIAWLVLTRESGRYATLQREHEQLGAARTALVTENASLKTEVAVARAEAEGQSSAIEARIRAAFSETAAAVLDRSNTAFLQLAGERMKQERDKTANLLEPFRVGINTLAEMSQRLENDRVATSAQLDALAAADREIRSVLGDTRRATDRVSNALANPTVRGRWGEVTLQRIAELAGLTNHIDFDLQVTLYGDDRTGRPDLVVLLPNNLSIPVDAKVPLDAYMIATELTDDAERTAKLREAAAALRAHVSALAARRYHEVDGCAGLTLLFVPLESMLYGVLSVDPNLFVDAAEKKIHIVSPMTLLTHMRGFAHGWALHAQQQNANEIVRVGKLLYERLNVFVDHFGGVGESLATATRRYNDAVGSYEARLLPAARSIASLAQLQQDPGTPKLVDVAVRSVAMQALTTTDGDTLFSNTEATE